MGALLIYSSNRDNPHRGPIGYFILASKGSIINSFLKWSLLLPRGVSQITTCLQYPVWLKFNKQCYWQINYLSRCCCQCQTECFEQRNRIDTPKGLSLIIHSSQKCRHTHFSPPHPPVVALEYLKKKKRKTEKSQPKFSGFLSIKKGKTEKLNLACHVM